ncbi:ABC transporter permease [Actinospica sp. MGRD01-02]|uniref:ABC transporter permease n=1 Tax=Actinospica acidithermotolerans TaxID=2828514 RepID=A0A941EA47_9ACTN|nr:ABC transporter permease [Actinospica acidithermotolerans]MBR7826808.1 ABC transporter permease [Actinospica acidithermotolerans]
MHDLPSENTQTTGNLTPSAGQIEREFTVKARTQTQLVVRRFLQHKLAVVSVFVLVAIVLLAFVGGALWHYSYTDITPDNSVSPSARHPFGTDNLGYDEFARVMRGTQRSLEIAFTVAILATIVGTVWGAIAGYYRGIADSAMMRFVDLVLTIPIIAAGALLGHHFQSAGWWALALVIAGLSWPAVSRIVRGQTLSLREKEYVEAARALGAKDSRIIFRHILPNVIGQVIVVVTILVALAILTESSLSYLGFGVQAPDTSLGTLIASAQTALQGGQWWLFYFPGIMIILICLSVNFIGDGLRDAFDPSQQRVRA